MTGTKEAQWETLLGLIALLRDEGVDVASCYDTPWTDGTWWTMEFTGDDCTGKKVAQLAEGNGCRTKVLQGQWELDGKKSVEWTLLFHTE